MKIQFTNNNKGFALIGIIVFFIVIGVLVGIGVTFLAPLTKKEKRTESRDIVRAAKEAVLGFAVQYKRLPDTAEFASRFKDLDAWGNTLFYYTVSDLYNPPEGNICYSPYTGFTVEDIGTNKTDIAFILLSKGENGANNTGETPTFTILQQSDTYDDIVEYGSIPELRNNVLACKELEIVTITLPDATEDTWYTINLIAKGGSGLTWSVSGRSLNEPGSGCSGNSYPLTSPNTSDLCLFESSGIITGTVNVSEATPAGTLTTCTDTSTAFTVTLSQTGLTSASKSFTITVNPQPLTITTLSLRDARKDTYYNLTLSGSGGKVPYLWSVISGTLPPGLTLSTTGVLSGIPATGGTYNFTVQLSDTDTCTTVSRAFKITVIDPTTGYGGSGLEILNNTGTSRGYKINSTTNPCNPWDNFGFMTVQPGSTVYFYNNTSCSLTRCSSQTLTYTFFLGYDYNSDSMIKWIGAAAVTCTFDDL